MRSSPNLPDHPTKNVTAGEAAPGTRSLQPALRAPLFSVDQERPRPQPENVSSVKHRGQTTNLGRRNSEDRGLLQGAEGSRPPSPVTVVLLDPMYL